MGAILGKCPLRSRTRAQEAAVPLSTSGNASMAADDILGFARDNDAEAIRALLAARCSPSYANRMGQTGLHIAAIWGSVDAAEALLAAGANQNAANKMRGQTPLHAAAMGRGPVDRRVECISLLLRYRADLQQRDFGGELPVDAASEEAVHLALGAPPLTLHKAVEKQSASDLAKGLEELAQASAGPSNPLESLLSGSSGSLSLEARARDSGMTALHAAADAGWRVGLEMLLAARANPSSRDAGMQTPLHAAALSGEWACLEILLRARADVNCRDVDPEHDPQFSSTSFKHDPQRHRTPLHYAASLGNLLAVRQLLAARSDPNCRDSYLDTPLHLCLGLRHHDANLQGSYGVQEADSPGRLGAIVEAGAERHKRDVLSPSAPADVAQEGALRLVLFQGASEAASVAESRLRILADETLDCLLEARADVNLGSRHMGETRTVLHEAARLGDVALAERVLTARADVNRQDARLGLSALHLAARSKHHVLVALLLQGLADPEMHTASGRTAAELAETNGAMAATMALLRGEKMPESKSSPDDCASVTQLADLTSAQRALLYID